MVKTALPSGSNRVTPKRLTIFSCAGFCMENNVEAESQKREYGKDGNNGTDGNPVYLSSSVCSVISVFSVLSLHPSAFKTMRRRTSRPRKFRGLKAGR